MNIAIAQINPTVGALEENAKKIENLLKKSEQKSDLIIFPELSITGYPPQDLLFNEEFVRKNEEVLLELVEKEFKISGVVGFVELEEDKLYNSAAVFSNGKVIGKARKTLLPTYDVFDEERYFTHQNEDEIEPITIKTENGTYKLGVEICEDLWDEDYDIKVSDILAEKGADIIINLSASPYYSGKIFERKSLLEEKAKKNKIPIIYANLVGGQDELVFDGFSMVVNASGDLISFGKQFKEDFFSIDPFTDFDSKQIPEYDERAEIYNALVLGLRDYFRKTGFKKAVLGLSGGIDSSLSACIATEALGSENVIGVSMPSRYSSEHSKTDAKKLANNLNIKFVKFRIEKIFNAYKETLKKPLSEIRSEYKIRKEDDDPVADENLQPRSRGNCLMDISNRLRKLGILVLNTGNKTELALGYCTLYGDMTGGIGAIGDLSKLQVYELSRYVNEKEGREVIPKNVLEKEPSAELKPDQTDPFNFKIVSPLVDEIVENKKSKKELINSGYPKETVEDIYQRIKNAEYKRRQMPPSIKITPQAFGIGWRMPIVNDFDG